MLLPDSLMWMRFMRAGRAGLCLVALLGQTGCVHALERNELSWEEVVELAAERAGEDHHPGRETLPGAYASLGYDEYRRIRFLEEHTLWAGEGLPFQVRFFHRGYLFPEGVRVHEFSKTHVQEIPFQRRFFDYDGQELPPLRGNAAAFAGLKINTPLNRPDKYDELVSFLGASYFRALGEGNVYGASARGLAVNLGADLPEEFPAFREFWLGKPLGNSARLTLYALLDSESVAGAYRFQIDPGAPTRIEVDAVLFARREGVEIGLAPLTSMFWYGEHSHPRPHDYRPEVHDSDGLSLRRADGTEVWRPLTAPSSVRRTEFQADNPTAFGLRQRDRDFDRYQDTEAAYHRRPSISVLPRGDWGAGALRLLEIPPHGEFADNIALAWIPAARPVPGEPYAFGYTLLWGDLPPESAPARVGETRRGRDLRHPEQTRFMIDFHVPSDAAERPEAPSLEVESSPADLIEEAELQALPEHPGRLRAALRVRPPPSESTGGELRVFLRDGDRVLSEIWRFPWTP